MQRACSLTFKSCRPHMDTSRMRKRAIHSIGVAAVHGIISKCFFPGLSRHQRAFYLLFLLFLFTSKIFVVWTLWRMLVETNVPNVIFEELSHVIIITRVPLYDVFLYGGYLFSHTFSFFLCIKVCFVFVFCTSNTLFSYCEAFYFGFSTPPPPPHPPSHPAITLCYGNGMRAGAGRSFPNVGSTCVDGV